MPPESISPESLQRLNRIKEITQEFSVLIEQECDNIQRESPHINREEIPELYHARLAREVLKEAAMMACLLTAPRPKGRGFPIL